MTTPNDEHGDCGDDDSGIMLVNPSGVDILNNLTCHTIPECDHPNHSFESSSSRSSRFADLPERSQDQATSDATPYNWQVGGSSFCEYGTPDSNSTALVRRRLAFCLAGRWTDASLRIRWPWLSHAVFEMQNNNQN